jgi:ribonucleoside-diphosphate reductase alpha chain
MDILTRHFTSADKEPCSDIKWEKRKVQLTNSDGETIFEQDGVEVPSFWSETSTTILATKYFRGTLGTEERETSLKQVVGRIVGAISNAFFMHGYGSKIEASILEDELTYMLVNQIMAFNSPVWFNVGVDGVPQQVSACFILDVEDDMDSILNWYREEGLIFKGGSGAGVNLSKIRSSKELLKGGGTASGPVSFMRGADSSAGTIKSGGKTRRAAKMIVLNIDHPDIEEFIWCKALEENKIRALRDAGFDMSFDGKDMNSVQYQNANNSVRVSDGFMIAVDHNLHWNLHDRNGKAIQTVPARSLWKQIAQAAWECADPGLQFDTTINTWNTTPIAGRIDASNPCSEHMRLANSSCNLASINLMKFFDRSIDSMFDVDGYTHAAKITFLAQNVLIDLADFPTPKIAEVTKKYRDLGLGYANLGALLMSMGTPYDSEEGRDFAAVLTSLLTSSAYQVSELLASQRGTCAGYEQKGSEEVVYLHAKASRELTYKHKDSPIFQKAFDNWDAVEMSLPFYGLHNSQMTVLAPTGTIGLLMGCDTTGIEPAFDLSTYKKLVGGGFIESYIAAVDEGLQTLNITSIDEVPRVFQTAAGADALSPESHVKMMGAVQPFLSGAISKTVNLPHSATVQDIENIHMLAWKSGLKSIAVYRDGCKAAQPLSGTQNASESTPAPASVSTPLKNRERLPRTRRAVTSAFNLGELEGYLTVGEYDDGRPGEVFIKVSKQGSTLAGIVDAWAIAVSLGLQHGVPLTSYVEKFSGMRFEPNGMTDDADVRIVSSLVDYISRRMALDYVDVESRSELGIFNREERIELIEQEVEETVTKTASSSSAPLCFTCGSIMRRAGACHVCESCGATSGCS